MIYKDKYASRDREDFAAGRIGEKCLNCGHEAVMHTGWQCDTLKPVGVPSTLEFFNLPTTHRYVTESMLASIGVMSFWPYNATRPVLIRPPSLMPGAPLPSGSMVYIDSSGGVHSINPPSKQAKSDTDNWRAWAHNRPGECPCGIVRNRCEYHR